MSSGSPPTTTVWGHRRCSCSLTRLCLEGFSLADLMGGAMLITPGGSPSIPRAVPPKSHPSIRPSSIIHHHPSPIHHPSIIHPSTIFHHLVRVALE